MAPAAKLALFYHSLGQLLESGVPIRRALQTAGQPLPATRSLIARIDAGDTLAEALAARPDLFPTEHVKLIAVAENSGRLEVACAGLAVYLDELIRLRRSILSGLLLPALILHAAAFIIPLPTLLIGDGLGAYLVASLGFLAGVWLVLGLGAVVLRALPATVLDRLLWPLPLLGRTWRELDYWRVAGNLEMLIGAGWGVLQGLRFCAGLCRSPRIARALHTAADQAESQGTPVSEALRLSGRFPDEFLQIWTTGEESGKLDTMLAQLARQLADRVQQRVREIARWLPRLVYGVVVFYLAAQILKLGTGYINLINSIE